METVEGDYEQLRSVGWFITGLCPDEKNGKGDHEQVLSVGWFNVGLCPGGKR